MPRSGTRHNELCIKEYIYNLKLSAPVWHSACSSYDPIQSSRQEAVPMLRVFATLKAFLGDGTRRKLSLAVLTVFSLSLLVITAVSLIVTINQKNSFNNVKRETPFQAAAQLQIHTFRLIRTIE